MPHDHENCTVGLPVEGFSLTVYWCRHHQAYSAQVYGFRQTDSDKAHFTSPLLTQDFGPFDTLVDVQGYIRRHWNAWVEETVTNDRTEPL